jgi:hypothetical protein
MMVASTTTLRLPTRMPSAMMQIAISCNPIYCIYVIRCCYARALLQYAFDELGFHRIEIRVVGFNTRALRFWTGLGFQQEGMARDSYYCDGQYSDFILMSIRERVIRY